MRKHKHVTQKETLATRGRKVSIKSHSRRTRGGRRIVVKSYTRKAGLRNKAHNAKSYEPSSGTEFENLRNRSPYGEPITNRLHTFQGAVEDALYGMKRFIGDKASERKRKIKEYIAKDKELNTVEKRLDKFLRKNGYQYKKYF